MVYSRLLSDWNNWNFGTIGTHFLSWTDPNNVQTGLCPRLPLPVISSNEGNPCSGSRLKRHKRSHMDSVQRSYGYDSLNDLFSSAQHRPTQLDQLPSCSFTLNPAQRDSEVFVGQLAVAFSSA